MTRQDIIKEPQFHITDVNTRLYDIIQKHIEATNNPEAYQDFNLSKIDWNDIAEDGLNPTLKEFVEMLLSNGYAPIVRIIPIDKYDIAVDNITKITHFL